ncbi:MAG: alcohol dehydrogenase catalytic domain-containing protein [Cyanobacteriota bacterium]
MKAAIYKGDHKIEISDIPDIELQGRKGAIVKTIGCGLCGSDLVKIKKNLVSPGTVLGHEVVGLIKEINTDLNVSFKIDDKVAVAHHVPCYDCKYCHQKSYSMCSNFKNTNLEPGGFSEYIFLSEQHLKYNTIKVPEEVNDLNASLMEPSGCILRALDTANIQSEQSVLIVGLGFIGLLFLQALKIYNCFILGCDIKVDRIEYALEIGIGCAFNSLGLDNSVDIINKTINFNGVDLVILASGSTESIELALKSVRDGGSILVFASIPDENVGYMNNDIYYRELKVFSVYSSAPMYLIKAMELIKTGKIKMDKYCEIIDLEDINLAIDKIVSHQAIKVYLKL